MYIPYLKLFKFLCYLFLESFTCKIKTSKLNYLCTKTHKNKIEKQLLQKGFHNLYIFIWQICYVFNETREMCSKVGRELLVSLATAHPFMLSLLIQRTHENMEHIGVVSGLKLYETHRGGTWFKSAAFKELLKLHLSKQ